MRRLVNSIEKSGDAYFMKAMKLTVLIVAMIVFISMLGCIETNADSNISVTPSPTETPGPTAITVASEYGFIPGYVMADLPVYPDATPTTFFSTDSVPVSVPFSKPIYSGTSRPGYQSASAQYSVDEYFQDILNWYVNELSSKGYRKDYTGGFGGGAVSGHEIAFFMPSEPLVNVEIRTYVISGDETILELLVTYRVPLPKPPEENLPNDVDSITVTYFSDNQTIEKTLTDNRIIKQLVNRVNALPVRPDYVYSCFHGFDTRSIFSLVFHSQSNGNITVNDVIGCGETGIHMGEYPILEDTHGLFREEVEQILGILNP